MRVIQVRKLYARWIEGVISDSIVVYGERPYALLTTHSEVEKLIQIDLWLIVLRFSWIARRASS